MDSLQDELDAIHALDWDKQQTALEGLVARLWEERQKLPIDTKS